MLDVWLQYQLDYNLFWDLTFIEIERVFQSQQKVLDIKNQNIYLQAVLTAACIGASLAGKEFPKYEEVFQKQPTEQEVKYQDAFIRDRMIDYMEAWNKQRRAGQCQKKDYKSD